MAKVRITSANLVAPQPRPTFSLSAVLREEIKDLRRDFDCGKCRQCEFRDCKLAVSLRTEHWLLGCEARAAERRAEEEEMKRSLRAALPKDMADQLDFEDLVQANAVWGRG